MSTNEEKLKKIAELRSRRLAGQSNIQKTNMAVNNSNSKSVEDIINQARKDGSIKIQNNPDLIRTLASTNNPEDIIAQYEKSGVWKFTTYSDTIWGKNVELYEEKTQCNLYEEIKAEIEQQLEDETLNMNIDKDRKFDAKRKVEFTKKAEIGYSQYKALSSNHTHDVASRRVSSINLPQIKSNTNETYMSINKKQEEIKKKLFNSNEVSNFIDKNSKYIERTLGEKEIYSLIMKKTYNDAYLDSYKNKDAQEHRNLAEDVAESNNEAKSILNDNKENNLKDKEKILRSLKNPMTESICFNDDYFTSKRIVTDLQWSAKHPELLLAGYSKSEDSNINDPHGLICLWSLAMRKKPEFSFTSQSEITSVIFHPFNPKILIAATYTGQILLFDTRGSNIPVSKTPAGDKNHTHPIYCLAVTGTSNTNNIISISNDAVLCSWNSNNISKPTKRVELKAKRNSNNIGDILNNKLYSMTQYSIPSSNFNPGYMYQEEFGVICMSLQENESNNVIIGTDDSDIYQVYTHGSNTNDCIIDTYKHHTGPVLSLDYHREDFFKRANLTNIFLSSSADWTVNLWSKNNNDKPILTFEHNEDYVYQAKFHPTNPSLFCTGDGSSNFDIWDVNLSTQNPIVSRNLNKTLGALNKASWSENGKTVALGDNNGKILLYDINNEIIFSSDEDSLNFERVLTLAKNNNLDF